MSHLTLKDNSRIIIIGGGPAGCFFALHALRLMKDRGIKLDITILEQRDFSVPGPKGCNMCAGIIGGRVVDEITNFGIELDHRVLRQDIDGFRVFLDGLNAEIKKRDRDRVYTIFRNQGPLGVNPKDEIIGFDAFLFNKTTALGVNFKKATVIQVLTGRNGEQPVVIYRLPDGNEIYEKADLLVIACGVNTALTRMFEFGYKPPVYWHTCQAEIELENPESTMRFIHIFSRKGSPFLFTALTPKVRYVTVTGIGKWVRFNDLLYEMEMLSVKKLFSGEVHISCHCHPRIPVTTAKNPYYDRIVMVGDACVSRYLKNGIESAFYTSKWAAETGITQGVDRESFENYYKKKFHEFFTRDNRYGKVMFFLHRVVSSSRIISKGCIKVLREESADEKRRYWLSDILWHMFAGDKPYRRIFRKTLTFSKLLLVVRYIFGKL